MRYAGSWGFGIRLTDIDCYFSLERKVTKSSRLNRLGYSGQRLRCRLRNSLRSDSAGSCRSVFALRLTPIRLGLSKKATLSLGMADTDRSSAAPCGVRGQATRARINPFPHLMRDRKEAGGIGHPQRAVRLYFRPKLVSVKRSDRSERPERLLFERSEFQTRQRTEGTE